MVLSVAGVPHCVPQPRPRAFHRVDQLQLNSGMGDRLEWFPLPVSLHPLLPHDNVEPAVGLEAENKPNVVIIDRSVDEKSSLKVNTFHSILADGKTWVRVQCLQDLCSFVQNHPLWVFLRAALWVKSYCLEVVEVRSEDPSVVRAVVQRIITSIPVKIIFALVSNLVIWKKEFY